MLVGERITSLREFLQYRNRRPHSSRWCFTYYIIEYDGSAECEQDIARFIGGFPYGRLTLVDTVLMDQYNRGQEANAPITRKLEDCISTINVGDWVCLSCGKLFLIPKDDVQECIHAWEMWEVDFDLDFYKEFYGDVTKRTGGSLYGKPNHINAAIV